jgi:hypothetical protein
MGLGRRRAKTSKKEAPVEPAQKIFADFENILKLRRAIPV